MSVSVFNSQREDLKSGLHMENISSEVDVAHKTSSPPFREPTPEPEVSKRLIRF